jgi:arylsulfatase A-like enzyme
MFRLLCLGLLACTLAAAAARPPNVVLLFADDLGYADLESFGGRTPTPHLNRLAREGIRFTDFQVAQAVCSASRAALLTGCLPNRLGITGALGPNAKTGLHPDEVTLAEVLKPRGYATAHFGKWHLGDDWSLLPCRQGFDEYAGLAYSNDMWPQHPTAGKNYPPLLFYVNDQVIQPTPPQERLTGLYTERAVRFIESNRDRPFFLYLAHSMPHVPLGVSEAGRGRTGRGIYADVIAEMDASVGAILDALDRLGLARDTLVMFTSDNGPWLSYGNHAGSAGHLREGKGTTFEGGTRVPFLARWPGRIPAGARCDELAGTMDVLPTVAALTRAEAPAPERLDGRDISRLLLGRRGAKSPHDRWFYYWNNELQAVRRGPWKLHFPHEYRALAEPGADGRPGRYETRRIGRELFDLAHDPGESADMAGAHPEIVAELERLAEAARADLGDTLTGRTGANVRPPGRVAEGTNVVIRPRPDGVIFLHARQATTHGEKLQYEPPQTKNTLGYWVNPADFATWDFEVLEAGAYEVEILYGCGANCGGSEVEFDFGGVKVPFRVEETGHFQNFKSARLGEVELPAGRHTLTLRALTKPGPAVMDLRHVLLAPRPN